MARAAPQPSRSPRRPQAEDAPPGGKGRGAQSNASGRYEATDREAIDDGWPTEDAPSPLTSVTAETPRRIINYVESPFVGFDRSINAYRGCEHGCIYCFARPTHAYYGLSPGLDFETKLFAKPNAATLLRRELSAAAYKPRMIAMGTNTDPYQPIERRFQIMRGILSVLGEFGHPASILTKSGLITRDNDLLEPLGARRLVKTMISVTTLDHDLARAMEPRASSPKRRLDAMRRLSASGVPVGVMAAPMIPGLNDSELENIISAAKEAGALWAGYTIIRLPLEVSTLFKEWLEARYPDRASRVLNHIRDMNGGRDYDPKWSRAEAPRSVYAKLIEQRFARAAAAAGLALRMPALDHSQFRRPVEKSPQLSLFDESAP